MSHIDRQPGRQPVVNASAGHPGEVGVRVRTHPALCSGWGNCHRFGGGVYPLDEDGHVAIHLLEVPAEHALDAWRGASVCPEHAISVIGPPESHWAERAERADRPGSPGVDAAR